MNNMTEEENIATYAIKVKATSPIFHSPKSRRFKCVRCGKPNEWGHKEIILKCECGKMHMRILKLKQMPFVSFDPK